MVQVYWHQNWPYNKDMPDVKTDFKAYAGCVPIAVAQLLTYYKYPKSIGGRNLDWGQIIADPSQSDASFLVRMLGDKMNSSYTDSYTSTKFDSAFYVLDSLGYTCRMKKAFTSEDLLSELNNRRPILIWGANLADPRERKSSHVWLIDGFLKQESIIYMIYTNGSYKSKIPKYRNYLNYFHCNWGWGICNGYFLSDLLTPFKMPKLAENINRGDSIYKPKDLEYHYDNHACLFVEPPK